ncbi:MAG: carotenoid 1,2-hydratase [Gammaproteobacteria bacterium]|nr:carotenoid 1,2-hydratase [Gammaproteobacteria bacterium]MBU0826456.1 carotenoid 1,2-hydratase [Gammaproteobacteria bacterium]MBU0892930.1 carotenoid 1,2-hydratase [Gammaproteobacteria bacterium]MBU1819868.1 carotenoid 1,2-hydratase [Gammaproteobacteria bacterium]
MHSTTRRQWLMLSSLQAAGLFSLWPGAAHALPARALTFPRDHGSHPDLRTEWWYITGHVQAGGQPWGFQVTFFRSRVDATQGMQSAFAAKQLLFAHAAVTDVQGQRLLHDQRIARAGFGLAQASEADTRIRLQDWTLVRSDTAGSPGERGGSRYTAHISGGEFALDLQFDSTQPVLLQGHQGLSRKGPDATQASYYYSQPQLAVTGALTVGGKRLAVTPGSGRAWMDHEWSEALLHPEALGWDWIGMNLNDGSALTAFRLRRADGSALWAGGSVRAPGQAAQIFDASAVAFTPERFWTSPQSGARYPVQWRVETPAGSFSVHAVLDAQELDSQGSTGAIYWEGLSDLRDAGGGTVGRGYLEMTGYAKPIRLG